MGRFRKFMPYTVFGMVVAWLAIAGVPPFSGFWAKDEIIVRRSSRATTACGSSALLAAVFTGVYMTRLIFLTFYGNERFRARRRPRRDAGGLGRLRRRRRARATPTPTLDSDPVADGAATATPVPYAARTATTPHERPGHGRPDRWCSPRSPRSVGLHQPAVRRASSSSTSGSSRSFHGVPELDPRRSSQGCALEVARGRPRARRHHPRVPALPPRPRARRPTTRSTSKLGAVAPVLGNAYYYDDGHRAASSTARAAACAGWLDRVVDTKVIDGAVNGVGGSCGGAARGLRHVQDGLVRRYALGIVARRRSPLLLYLVVWAGR